MGDKNYPESYLLNQNLVSRTLENTEKYDRSTSA